MNVEFRLCLAGLACVAAIGSHLSATELQSLSGADKWTVPYGKEFWRRGIKAPDQKLKDSGPASLSVPANIDLGDIIDRVSHAITQDEASAVSRVQAKTYTARFEGTGVRFSPHRPWNSKMSSGEATGVCMMAGFGSEGQENGVSSVSARGFERRLPASGYRNEEGERRRFDRKFPMPDAGTEVILRIRSVRLGDWVLYERTNRSMNWSFLGNTAQALLNERIGLVEHYEARGEGVQISWVLRERPAGAGSLEIELEMDGLSYTGTSDRGIHLAYPGGTPRVRIGKAFAVDSAGRRTEVAMVAHDGRLHVRVPGEILAEATYPLAIDPLISPEFGMDEPVIVPRDGGHAIPAVAWNGTNWLVVWTEWNTLGWDSPVVVAGARVSKGGDVLDPFGILISQLEEPPAAPAVASNGKDYFVVWGHLDFVTGFDMHGARVIADGQVAAEDRIVINSLPGDQQDPSIAGGTEGYLVVWRDNSGGAMGVYGTRVSNDGVVLDGDGFPITMGLQFQPSVARGPDGFLVVWSDDRQFSSNGSDIYGTRLDANATVLDTDGIAICTGPKDQRFPTIAANSNAYLVVWEDLRNSTADSAQTDIYGTLVTPAGVVLHPQGIAVSIASGYQAYPSVAPGADDFLVVWNDSRPVQPGIYASRVSAAGGVLNPGGVLVDPVPKTYVPVVAAFDNGFLVVWDRSSNPAGGFGSGILGARLNSQAEVMDAEPILITPKDNDQGSPAVASNGTNWLVVWQDWRSITNWSDIYGVRIGFDGSPLDSTAIPISTQPGFEMDPAVASAGGDYLVVWIDDRNAAFPFTDIYGARVRADGTVMDPDGIGICRAAGSQNTPAVTSDETNYFVVWYDGRNLPGGIYATRVNRDGVVLELNGFLISASTNGHVTPDAAFNGKDFLVVWRQGLERTGDIYGTRVSTDGIVLDMAGIPISRAPFAQTSPAVASAGNDFLVIWADTRNPTTTNGHTFGGEIYGARVDAKGAVPDPDGFRISTEAYRAFPSLAFNGTGFVAVWDNRIPGVSGATTEIRAAWIDDNGKVLLGDLTINTNGAYPAVAAGASNNFLVVAETPRNGPTTRVVGNLVSFGFTPFLSLTLAGDGATIAWRAQAGKTYRVQFKPDLSYTTWVNLDPVVTATNSVASILDPTIGGDSQRFYRVVQLP